MRYAVVINLDYSSHPEESCREVWRNIKVRMIDAGFRCDGRIFTIDDDSEDSAYARARSVIDAQADVDNKSVFMYIKDFYGFDMACTTNLSVPPATAIEIEE